MSSSYDEDIPLDAICRICLDDAKASLFRPCLCQGTMMYVHRECLETWRRQAHNPLAYQRCQQCNYQYNLSRNDAGTSSSLVHAVTFVLMLITWGYCTSVFQVLWFESVIYSALLGLSTFGLLSLLGTWLAGGGCG